ncbi:MAG: protein kinase [Myxococcota bacterium]|nr:protein kinase [Myxococcota bacterium]
MGDTVGGRYELDGRLGEGGMGCVYRARHLQLGKAFALKIISPAYALDAAARARFNQEAKLASEISHPNIVSVVDFGEDPALGAYMVMELVEGDPLINEGGNPMAVRRVCDILGQIADALDHIHRRGIIHGDVKADNIMLTTEQDGARRRRVARLLDFGLARRPDGAEEEQISGSPHYLAPERAAGGPPTVAADIYAMGILGYLMLTGTLPFEGNVVEILMAHINQAPDTPSARRREPIEESLETMILRAMAKDPAKRHGSAAAFRYELNTVMDMLDMGRRRTAAGTIKPEDTREAVINAAFDRSRIPQALLSLDGVIVYSNKAFLRLLGQETPVEGLDIKQTTLHTVLPGLQRAMRTAHSDGKPCERRARVFRGNDQPSLELCVWLSPLPLPGTEIHMMIRVEESDGRRRDE